MTEAAPPPARSRFRKLALIAGIAVAAIAAGLAWIAVGDSSGCAAETPAVFSRLYHISSNTMEPGIEQGDWLWAERRYYFTRDPERGDVAVLALPSYPSTVFVTRVIGLPGDRVQLQKGELFLNGEPVRRDWLESTIHAGETGEAAQRTRFMERLPTGTGYAVEVADPDAPLENTGKTTVPEGRYFVLGDNRDHSEDSRAADFGLVPRGAIADRPIRVLWSGDRSRIGLRLGAPP
jgi:signal peptidase I